MVLYRIYGKSFTDAVFIVRQIKTKESLRNNIFLLDFLKLTMDHSTVNIDKTNQNIFR